MFARISLVFLAACAIEGGSKDPDPVDSDGDGLFDDEEASLGTDPALSDTDGDGLGDLEERDLGTDPTAADTDGDTYSDSAEVTEGTDPLDAESRIYTGYWPYNPDKDSLEDPGFDGRPREGNMFPRLRYTDQFGEVVDLYDYAGQGKPIVVDISAEWCSYCQELAKELEGRRNYFDGYWPHLEELVANGDVYWVTVLAEDSQGRSSAESTAAAATRWSEEFEHPLVAVLGDDDYELTSWSGISGYPWAFLLDDTMTITVFDSRSNNLAPLDALEEMYENGEIGGKGGEGS